ncbi:ornithine cyclodeaminase family protein [Cellulomonas shaoxiangyii]|uniref:Ornithine cyclodeaminase family protein n=1 Tax=Cellulomonas shaoxiangyii TaxID=2566013 RepID=A0A4P7SEK7_9CELL|nr:ornithine cyclodeaminase family protein [Cellulomonas shaoxiangyii]QCB92270.1 ornithine cyclodeaminase family protein [Cellulomonas shaoxiangyii]TGY85918.1 ornithine cyclodeaminase family protein [Cellulomonas shaoxiangyii]
MRYLDADAVLSLGPAGAVAAVVDALRDGLDPAEDLARIPVGLEHGQLLLMPSQRPTAVGVKVATVAPDNPRRGLPRIQATYLLFDPTSLALRAALDGTALTTLRTPAVSVATVLPALPDRPLHLAVVGAGPQALGHVRTLAAVRPLATVTHLLRDPVGGPVPAVRLGSPEAAAALGGADVVVCATSARVPVFDSSLLGERVVVVAVGSHEPDARELDGPLLERATVVVEDVATALREAGDVVLAVAEGRLRVDELVPLREVVRGTVALPADRPVVFKGVGMSWQDVVVAEAVLRHTDTGR